MRIGVISEGHADRAVIINILKGVLEIDSSDIVALRPQYATDETDKAIDNPLTKSSYSIIKKECEGKDLIEDFFSIEGQEFITVHIDTAEADRYGVDRPNKNEENYSKILRENVVREIDIWLKQEFKEKILHAVAIEETDAWVHTIYDNVNSENFIDAKKKLSRVVAKKGIKFIQDPFDYYLYLSKPFSKNKNIKKENYTKYNESLSLFIEEIKEKVLPLIEN